jgi:hypothetical protein
MKSFYVIVHHAEEVALFRSVRNGPKRHADDACLGEADSCFFQRLILPDHDRCRVRDEYLLQFNPVRCRGCLVRFPVHTLAVNAVATLEILVHGMREQDGPTIELCECVRKASVEFSQLLLQFRKIVTELRFACRISW